MSSISSVGASSYVPQAQNDEILRKIPRGASSQVAQAPASRPGSAGAPGGYGGGSAFAAQVIGQAPVSSAPSTGGGSAPVGGSTPTGPSTSPGPTAPTSNSYSMQSGDGFDLLTSTTVAGGGPWGGDFTLTDNGRGGIDITMGPGFGNQMSIQRGQSFDGTTDASGTDLQPTYDAQTVNAGDTIVIDTGGFAQYAIGNIQKGADGSITFSEKQLNGPDYYGTNASPSPQGANAQDANGQDASSQSSSMRTMSMQSNSAPADSGVPTMAPADAALVSSVISETSGGEATTGAETLAGMQAQSAAMQSYFAAQVYASNMTMAAVSGGSVVSDGSGGSTVSTAGGGGSSGTSAAGGGGGGAAAGGGGSSSAATTSSASSGSSAGSSTASTSS